MTKLEQVLKKIQQKQYIFINKEFKSNIDTSISNVFPKLNREDKNVLQVILEYLIEYISVKYFYLYNEKPKNYMYDQWTQNNKRDIIALLLTLLPFINDKNNNRKNFNNLTDLNLILFNKNINEVKKYILEKDSMDIYNDELSISNFSIGLMNKKEDTILDLYQFGEKLIYTIIHHNFVSMLETVKITNGKLYVNWVNVIPLTDYKISSFYKYSNEEIVELTNAITSNNNVKIREIFRNNKYLWFGDYYNVMRNGYYESIKKIKWVLYNKKVDNERYYYIQYLSLLFNFNLLFKFDSYDNLDKYDQDDFKNKLIEYIDLLNSNTKIKSDYYFEVDIFKNLLLFMFNNSTERFTIPDNIKKPFIMIDDENQDLDNIEKKEIDIDIIKETIYSLVQNNLHGIIWNYIKESVYNLENTVYGKYLIMTDIDSNKIINPYFFYLIKDEDTYYTINLKNIYNIAKNLSHNSSWELLGTNFKNLSLNDKKQFFTKFLVLNRRWLNLRENIKRQGDLNYNTTINNILLDFSNINIKLVWDYLSENGILSRFTVNQELTNDKYLPGNINNKRNKIKRILKDYFDPSSSKDYKVKTKKKLNDKDILEMFYKEYYINDTDTRNEYYEEFKKNRLRYRNYKNLFDANYFVTSKPYYKLDSFSIDGEKNSNKDYYKALTGELAFYMFYAMDWIQQINFYNHYINHSIIYVTGGTGTGKSTQVPKLLMYSLKMYDYKNNGQIICTQPRISPTEGNAKWISKEMGVQNVRQYKSLEMKTDKYYLQYKDQKDRHTRDNSNHLMLRMATDGTLFEELLSNPLLKTKVKKPVKDGKEDFMYGLNNKYDIVIVDEAHEHNTNMDLILTLMKQTCFYNNSIRLVIVSATMDDDEPIYRSYFRNINDNLVYPIKRPLSVHPILDIDDFMIESIFLDRRIHISIFGQTTQYTINEYYDEDIEKQFGSNEKKNSILAQEKSYDKILDICNKSTSGQMLLFLTGENEIKKALQVLNKNLPNDVIALPFYSNMNSKYRDIVEKVSTKVLKIRNRRENIYLEWGEKYIDAKDVPEGTYKRAVIVATNVAEASITIDGLKYVIDTGYAKVLTYNRVLDIGELNIEKISEASRIQRKGRVGRVASGDVYYMYGKGMRANIKPKYGINQIDFSESFIKLAPGLGKNYTNPSLVDIAKDILKTNSISNSFWSLNNIPHFINLFKLKEKGTITDLGIIEIIKSQYLFNQKDKLDKNYYIEPYFNNYLLDSSNYLENIQNDFNFIVRYNLGLPKENLYDNNGTFYIIHPNETNIKRNICGGIIKYKDSETNELDPYHFKYLENNLKLKLQYLKFKINNKDFSIKTNLIGKVNDFRRMLESEFLTENDGMALLLAEGYNVLLDACEILSLLSACNNNLSALAVKKNSKIIEYEPFYNRFRSDSDIVSLSKICKLFRTKFNFSIYKIINNKGYIYKKFRPYYEKLLNIYNSYNFTIEPPKEYLYDWNILNWLKFNGKLNMTNGFLYWLGKSGMFKNMLANEIKNNYNIIEKVCEEENIDSNVIKIYFMNLTDLLIGIISADKDIDVKYNEESIFDWIQRIKPTLQKPLPYLQELNKLDIVFIFSNPLNISILMDYTDNNYTLLKNNETAGLQTTYLNGPVNTLLNNTGSLLFYLKNNIIDGQIYITTLINITSKSLTYLFPFHYNNIKVKNQYIVTLEKGNTKIINFNGQNWNRFITDINNFQTFNYNPFNNRNEFPLLYLYKNDKESQSID